MNTAGLALPLFPRSLEATYHGMTEVQVAQDILVLQDHKRGGADPAADPNRNAAISSTFPAQTTQRRAAHGTQAGKRSQRGFSASGATTVSSLFRPSLPPVLADACPAKLERDELSSLPMLIVEEGRLLLASAREGGGNVVGRSEL